MKEELIVNEEEEIYRENILDHYKNPHNYGSLNNCTFTHSQNNPICGDNIAMFVNLENDKVKEIKFSGTGCAISIASASLLTEKVYGMNKNEIKKLTKEDIQQMIGVPLSVIRIKCALLSLVVLSKGLEEWENKNHEKSQN